MKKNSSLNIYILFMLAALEILMSFTFLGYFHIPPISITFAYIPVVMAAYLLDPAGSAAIGAVFGLASVYKATASYVQVTDQIFSPFLSGKPLASILLAVGSRVLFGFLIGLIFQAAKKSRRRKIWIGVAGAIAPKFHGLVVYIVMRILFPEIIRNYLMGYFFTWSDILALVVCALLSEALDALSHSGGFQNFQNAINDSRRHSYFTSKCKQGFLAVITVFVVGMTVAAAFFFSNRTSVMLESHQMDISEEIRFDLTHLQIQFLMAVLSLNMILVVILKLSYQYGEYQRYIGEIDVTTNVMGRRMFLNCCEKLQKDMQDRIGWFLFLDADHFKSVNDTMGHAAGDQVLQEIAETLKRALGDCGMIGRIGGDEFAAMISKPIRKEELEKRLDLFLEELSKGRFKDQKISCSIGVCAFTAPAELSGLMNKTDQALYQAKNRGRACYVILE